MIIMLECYAFSQKEFVFLKFFVGSRFLTKLILIVMNNSFGA